MRPAHCWHVDDDGTGCDAALVVDGPRYRCPNGHRLRQWDDLSPWLRDHIHLAQTSPRLIAYVFDGKGHRPC